MKYLPYLKKKNKNQMRAMKYAIQNETLSYPHLSCLSSRCCIGHMVFFSLLKNSGIKCGNNKGYFQFSVVRF